MPLVPQRGATYENASDRYRCSWPRNDYQRRRNRHLMGVLMKLPQCACFEENPEGNARYVDQTCFGLAQEFDATMDNFCVDARKFAVAALITGLLVGTLYEEPKPTANQLLALLDEIRPMIRERCERADALHESQGATKQ